MESERIMRKSVVAEQCKECDKYPNPCSGNKHYRHWEE